MSTHRLHFRKPKLESAGGTQPFPMGSLKHHTLLIFSLRSFVFSREASMNLLVVPLYTATRVLVTEQKKETRGLGVQDIDCYLIHLFQGASHSALDCVSQVRDSPDPVSPHKSNSLCQGYRKIVT